MIVMPALAVVPPMPDAQIVSPYPPKFWVLENEVIVPFLPDTKTVALRFSKSISRIPQANLQIGSWPLLAAVAELDIQYKRLVVGTASFALADREALDLGR